MKNMMLWMCKNKFLTKISKYALSLSFIFLSVWYNFTALVYHPIGGHYSSVTLFTILFINLMLLIIILMPLITDAINKSGNDRVESFLALPKKDVKINYIIFYDYLSGIALSAFLFATFIYTNKYVFNYSGIIVSAIYSMFMYISSIFIAVVSLVRFIMAFQKFSNPVYTMVVVIASFITWLWVKVAILMTNISG